MTQRRKVALVSMRMFGARFTRIRLDRGLTQRQIALSAGVHESFISLLVTGTKGCKAETAMLIAAALGTPKIRVEHLFDDRVHPVAQSSPSRPRSTSSLPAAVMRMRTHQ